MMMVGNTTKLELTCIGKDDRSKLEPRILLEDPEKSYHANQRVSDDDIFDNRLIFGDNLLALKALEQKFAGRVRCIFIDPPYNTGSAFEHYDDGVEHFIWLSLMRDRLEILNPLLTNERSLWITIDDNEAHYLKVVCDEVFGRSGFVCSIAWEKDEARHNDTIASSVHDHILLCVRNLDVWRWPRNLFPQDETNDSRCRSPDADPQGRWIQDACNTAKSGSEKLRFPVMLPSGRVTVPPPGNFQRFLGDTLKRAETKNRAYYGKDGRLVANRKELYFRSSGWICPEDLVADRRDGIKPIGQT